VATCPRSTSPNVYPEYFKKTGLEWKPDIMRHSYASYHLAFHQSADKTALEMGHRDTPMLFRHYRELVTKEEAQAYWKIEP
jgi:integrase